MKMTKTGLVFIMISLSVLPLFSMAQQHKISKIKVYAPNDPTKRSELLGLLEIDHFYTDQDGGIISEINERELARLQSTPYRYQILVPDVMKQLDSLNKIYYASLKKPHGNGDDTRVAFE